MPSTSLTRTNPLVPIAVGMSVAGTAKLAGAQFTRDNFARWGYHDWFRPVVGVIEVATGLAAVSGLRNDTARTAAAAGTLATMGAAIATHATSEDSAPNLVPPVLLAGFGFLALLRPSRD